MNESTTKERTTMLLAKLFPAVLVAAALAGCETDPKPREVNTRIIESLNCQAVENAIVMQSTLYAYHFVVNGPELNELGERDMDILVDHFKVHPGTLNVSRAQAGDELYSQRVQTVMAKLVAAGIDSGQIRIVDGMPGGSGMPTQSYLQISRGRNSPSRPLYGSDGGGTAESGNMGIGNILGGTGASQ